MKSFDDRKLLHGSTLERAQWLLSADGNYDVASALDEYVAAVVTAERARITEAVRGLPINRDITWAEDEPVQEFVNLAAVLAAVLGTPQEVR